MLPYNLIQRILAERFPCLGAFQQSVEPNEMTEKNLHVSLCRLYHGLGIESNVSPAVFRELLRQFVNNQLNSPDDFGFRDYRLPIRLEMRAILDRIRDSRSGTYIAAASPRAGLATG